jgi:transposase-like protein
LSKFGIIFDIGIVMQQKGMNYLEWTRHFSTDAACLEEIARHRWPGGFLCSRYRHDHAFVLSRGQKRQCAHCRYQVSVIAGTIFHHTHVPLTKWFAAIHLIASGKGGVSALRLSKLMGVSWPTASRMLRLLRRAMHDRDRSYWLSGLVEIDDALVGGYRAGKRGRGAEGKTPVLLAVEKRGERSGFLAAQVMTQGLNQAAVREFSRRNLAPGSRRRSICKQRAMDHRDGTHAQ